MVPIVGERGAVIILLLVLSFSLSTIVVPSVLCAEDSWETMADMPTARSGLGVAVVNGKIYAIGREVNYEYDPIIDTWTTKKPMSTPRYSFGIAVFQNKIYVIGGDMETTIIDGDNVGQVVNITACDHVNITCFTIRNSGPLGEGYSSAGIGLWEANYCNISVNKVTTNAFGIVAIASYSNIIFENIIEENSGSGVTIDGWGYPNYNSIHGNEIVNNIGGVEISSGKNNTIYENNITKNGNEIILDDSHNNSILRNNIGSLGSGSITFTFSSNNTFQHNNFKNIQVVDRGWLVPPWIPNSSINIWDNGIEGNYWNNYQGSDHNGDGIGDKPHTINENNQDNHPLMEPFIIPEFPAWTPLLIMLVAVAVLIYKRKLSQTPAN
jgi:parallel beta-helix repeat protein